ncbi:MAG: FGGY-family carbohydrate kinase [Eubacteriales bacterium]
MTKEIILSIDCGTQSIRAMIFNHKGTLLVKVHKVFDPPYIALKPGWAERDAQYYWQDLMAVTLKIKEDQPELFHQIAAVTITTQRDTCVLIDKEGNLLRPAILWLDQRKIAEPRPMNPVYQWGSSFIGMRKTIMNFNRGCHGHWIQEAEPEIWDKTYKYLLLSTYLIFKLTGRFIDTPSAQTGHMPFNYKKKTWEHPYGLKSNIFQIPKSKLYPLVHAGEMLGNITKRAHLQTGLLEGLPVIASGSDKACETLGVGCLQENVASVSLGSQATIETSTKRYFETTRFIPPFPAVVPDLYNPEINVYRGYWMISWFKKEFALEEILLSKEKNIPPEDLLNFRLEEIPPGSEGLILQPYWGNEIVRPESRGAIIGFHEGHTRMHIYRAIIEGIGYALLDGFNLIQKKSGIPIARLALSGGGARSSGIAQITANIFNRQVYTVQTNETSGLGAAIAAFVGIGVHQSFEEAVKNMVHETAIFYPDPLQAEIYQNLYNRIYKKIYIKLKSLYHAMDDIENKW